MDSGQFAEAYTFQPERSDWSEGLEVGEVLKDSREWSSFFDDTLMQHLEGGEPPDSKDFMSQITAYYFWSRDELPKTVKKVSTLGATDGTDFRGLNELTFHIMTANTLRLWQKVILQEEWSYAPDFLTDTQTLLAIQAAKIARERKMIQKNEDMSGIRSNIVGSLNGQLTEIDSYVGFIEVMRNDPTSPLTVLAAPPIFESGSNRRKNIDLIAIQTVQKQARGFQIKTRTSNVFRESINYDSSCVTLIDGFVDLGNSTGSYESVKHRGDNDSSFTFVAKAAPGYISMDHLQRISVKDVPIHQDFYRQELMRAKSIARELSANRKSFISSAAKHLSSKVLHDLCDVRADESA